MPRRTEAEYKFRSDILRRRRVRRMMTQEDLAHRAGLSMGQVNRMERGVIMEPHFSTIHKLAGALGIEADELIEFPSDK